MGAKGGTGYNPPAKFGPKGHPCNCAFYKLTELNLSCEEDRLVEYWVQEEQKQAHESKRDKIKGVFFIQSFPNVCYRVPW